MTALESKAEVDGHDMGSDEMNVFNFTNDPTGVFEVAKKVVNANERRVSMRAPRNRVRLEQ